MRGNLYEIGGALSRYSSRLRRAPRQEISYWPKAVSWLHIVLFVILVAATFVLVDPYSVAFARELPRAVYFFFTYVTQLGASKWTITPIAVLLLALIVCQWKVFNRRNLSYLHAVSLWLAAALISLAGGGIAINLIKRMIGRARPKHFDELGSFAFDPFAFSSSFASFPSGHATTAGSVAVLLILFFPKWRWVIVIFAALTAASRVIIGSHYPSDIILGLAVGCGISWLVIVFFARRGLGFVKDPSAFFGLSPKRMGKVGLKHNFFTLILHGLYARFNGNCLNRSICL